MLTLTSSKSEVIQIGENLLLQPIRYKFSGKNAGKLQVKMIQFKPEAIVNEKMIYLNLREMLEIMPAVKVSYQANNGFEKYKLGIEAASKYKISRITDEQLEEKITAYQAKESLNESIKNKYADELSWFFQANNPIKIPV